MGINTHPSNRRAHSSMNLPDQPCRTFTGHASNHAATIQGSIMSNAFATSNDSLATSLTSTAAIPNTAATSMTALNTSSVVHPTTSDITTAVSPTQSETSSNPLLMPCVCCWGTVQTLLKHYPSCPGLKGDRVFWASPYYYGAVFHDRKAFTNHMRSFKPDDIHIESTRRDYVTPRAWTTQFREDAMKRQLINILYEYFTINPEFAGRWQALNDGDMSPNLNNVVDLVNVLGKCSEILCRPQPGGVKESPVAQLRVLFLIDDEAVAEIPTQPVRLSRKRKCSVPYNALNCITPIDQARVEIADSGFTEEAFARHQQSQLGEQAQTRYLSMGGVSHADSRWVALGSSGATPIGDTFNAPSPLGHHTQSSNGVPDEIFNGFAEFQYGTQTYFADNIEFPSQTLLQGQNAYAFPHANPNVDDIPNALDSWYAEYLSQYPLPLQQVQSVQKNTNMSASNDFGTFDNWNCTSMPQYQQTLLQMSKAHLYPNASVTNGLDPFDIGNPYAMAQYLQPPQQRQDANTNTNHDLRTLDSGNPGPFPPHTSTIATGYEHQQYTNPLSHDYYAS